MNDRERTEADKDRLIEMIEQRTIYAHHPNLVDGVPGWSCWKTTEPKSAFHRTPWDAFDAIDPQHLGTRTDGGCEGDQERVQDGNGYDPHPRIRRDRDCLSPGT